MTLTDESRRGDEAKQILSSAVYKDAWSHADAVTYLLKQSGRQFDPELTSVLLANDRELLAIREQHPD